MTDRDQAHAMASKMGLLPHEFDAICEALGRPPSPTEIAVFAGMWSEHCSYKSTLRFLRGLPTKGEAVLAGPGSHAGVVALNEDWALAFKVESHNHPSAVEPYQGAATGVGGILRDIIAQGARPCAVMDSLCFGDPQDPTMRHLVDGVVAGIAGYGNAIGIANVGGRTVFDDRYTGNILVNALAAGLIKRKDGLRHASGAEVGDLLLYAGAPTGRDGILGAAFASEELSDDSVEDRPHVQVGDPFAGKKIMEACLAFGPELGMKAGQDMGAAGVTCSSIEMAAASDVGVDIELNAIPLREAGMSPQEIMLSESQERFMFTVDPALAQQAVAHFKRYGVSASICGKIVPGDRARAIFDGEVVVDVPAVLVADGCPPCDWPLADLTEPYAQSNSIDNMPASDFHDLGAALLSLVASPNHSDKRWLTSQYDQTVGNRTVAGPDEASASVMRLEGSREGFALTLVSRPDLCGQDAFYGAQLSVCESFRRLASVGATPLAITDGLNVASPRNPVENRKLERTIEGLKVALLGLGIPVTGGNCSLYNESKHGPIPPTPMVGAVGTVADVTEVPRYSRIEEGDKVFLVGPGVTSPTVNDHDYFATGKFSGPVPLPDFEAEKALGNWLFNQHKLCRAVVPLTRGGLAVALAKLVTRSRLGLSTQFTSNLAPTHFLFCEAVGSALVVSSTAPPVRSGISVAEVGKLGGDALSVTIDGPQGETEITVSLEELQAASETDPREFSA